MFTDTCVCGAEAEVTGLQGRSARCKCWSCGREFESELDSTTLDIAREYFYVRASFPQGASVRVKHGDEMLTVEVVGHKAISLLTGRPVVRVYIPGYGAVLFTRQQMEQWN